MMYIMCINDGLLFHTQKECAEYYNIDHVLLNHVISGRRKSTDNKTFCKAYIAAGLSPFQTCEELAHIRRYSLAERLGFQNVYVQYRYSATKGDYEPC